MHIKNKILYIICFFMLGYKIIFKSSAEVRFSSTVSQEIKSANYGRNPHEKNDVEEENLPDLNSAPEIPIKIISEHSDTKLKELGKLIKDEIIIDESPTEVLENNFKEHRLHKKNKYSKGVIDDNSEVEILPDNYGTHI